MKGEKANQKINIKEDKKMTERLEAIGLTDYYFKELIKRKKNYLTLLLNGICNLDLKESDITLTDTEERDLCTLKTVNYDIKVVI